MYELIILAHLMRRSMHGYLLAKIINDIIGPYARVSNGRLYPLLAKLEESGLIEFDEETNQERHGERNARSYRITEAGRVRFRTLMMGTTSNPGEYQRIFEEKVPVLYLLQPSERLFLIEHYLNYCQSHVLYLLAEREDLARRFCDVASEKAWLLPTLDVMSHKTDEWRLKVQWAQSLRERELACQQKEGVSVDKGE